MTRALRIVVVLGAVLAFVPGLYHDAALSRDTNIKSLMGENFGHMQKILIELVTGNYRNVPHDVEIIREHAVDLSKRVPEAAQANRELFLSLAYNLQIHSNNLGMITRALLERDQETEEGKSLKIDYLRNSAAAHYGHMVTACVACHNQFRRRIVPMKK